MDFPEYDCRYRSPLSRRGFLGTAAAGGFFGFALANRGQSLIVASTEKRIAKRLLVIWADGGPSQFETFDMEVGRPTGGMFREISTNLAGSRVCELMPNIAQRMDRLAVIRSMRTSQISPSVPRNS